MATANFISHSRLLELLSYSPSTGVFMWNGDRGGRSFKNKPAGHLKTNGYIEITVDGWRYNAHRLAWYYTYGKWPKNDIDHINGERSDNRIENLRDVFPYLNFQNVSLRSSKNSTGVRGVSKIRDKFRAEIRVQNKRLHLGVFDSIDDAAKAYLHAKQVLTGQQEFRR
jgi:hypothetical protein